MIELRPYQTAAIDRARDHLIAGARSVLIVCPTGGGKTAIGTVIVSRAVANGARCLWLAHRVELIDQGAGSLSRSGLIVGTIAPRSSRPPNPYAPVQVASIQTLLARDARPAADLVVFDEAHHAASDTYSDLFAHYAGAIRIGLTATPERDDGRALDQFERLVPVATIRELTAGGYLVPCSVIAPAAPLRPGQIAQRPVDAYLAHAAGRSALVFSPGLEMAAQHAEEFRAAGIDAAVVEGSTAAGERRAALESFKTGRLRVLVNVGVLTEGTDLPIASAAILARGCGSAGLYLQITGRVLRPHPGKTDAVLIDLRGVSHVHGAPDEDREYSLAGRGIRRAGENGDPQSYCRVCGAPVQAGTDCAECGAQARAAKPLKVTGDPLVKFASKRAENDDKRAATLARWLDDAAAKGHKPGSALYKFHAVYGHWATPQIRAAAERLRTRREVAA